MVKRVKLSCVFLEYVLGMYKTYTFQISFKYVHMCAMFKILQATCRYIHMWVPRNANLRLEKSVFQVFQVIMNHHDNTFMINMYLYPLFYCLIKY
jgi:hypothetical protein